MGSSAIGHVPHVVNHVLRINPGSILDIGVGFGRWGFLCREILECFHERVPKEKWEVRIEGIEIYEPYIQDHQQAIYDHIHIGDALEVLTTLGDFDLIIIGDMLEHLTKENGWSLLHLALQKANKGIIVNVPIGEEWLRETGYDNKYEDHLAWWAIEEFDKFKPDTFIRELKGGSLHASMFFSRANYDYSIAFDEAGKAEEHKDISEASRQYQKAIELNRERPEAYTALARLLIENGQVDDAEAILTNMVHLCPDFLEGRLLLAKLLKRIGKIEEAREHAMKVVEKADGLPEIKSVASAILK